MDNPFLDYVVSNFALLIISVGMILILAYNYRSHIRANRFCFLIIITALVLSIVVYLGEYLKAYGNLRFLDTLLIALSYILRPAVLFLFALLAEKPTRKAFIFSAVPLFLTVIVYSFSLFLDTPLGELTFYLTLREDGTLGWNGGSLRYFSHIIGALYLAYVLFISVKKVRSKHAEDAFVLFACTFFVIIATILESIFDIYTLINATIAASCVFYYLFLHNQSSRKDVLTGLYGRATYYADIARFGKQITAIIQLDMNGLKYINDNFGHEAGDEALITVAKIMEKNAGRNRYCYRLGGDEFIVLSLSGSQEDIALICDNIRSDLLKTEYNCAVGWACRKSKDQKYEEILKESESYMYKDKEIFYKNSKLERRKQSM